MSDLDVSLASSFVLGSGVVTIGVRAISQIGVVLIAGNSISVSEVRNEILRVLDLEIQTSNRFLKREKAE